MNSTISKRRMIKRSADAAYHNWWYSLVPNDHKPKNVRLDNEETLSYDFVQGGPPELPDDVIATAERTIWAGSPQCLIHKKAYQEYVERVRVTAAEYFKLKWMKKDSIEGLLYEITQHALTNVGLCHGDLTMENTVSHNGNIVFIDPGHHRGLACREIDEAKLMQSVDGWEHAKYGQTKYEFTKFKPRRIHKILLLTHYFRLLRHAHPIHAIEFALQRSYELAKELTHG